jgi:hypothetical protein
MALDDLLAKMEGRAVDTSDTACNPSKVSAKPAPNKACTLDTPDASQNISAEDWVLFNAWLFHFTDRNDLPVTFAPAVNHEAALSYYPDAVVAEQILDRAQRKPSKAEANEITALVQAVFASDSDVDRNEALAVALADPDGALLCYRTIAEERGIALPDTDDDRRRCTQCLNLRGRACIIAQPGGLVSARQGYQPIRDVLHRCAGYQPDSSDMDHRTGGERWPGLIAKGNKHENY